MQVGQRNILMTNLQLVLPNRVVGPVRAWVVAPKSVSSIPRWFWVITAIGSSLASTPKNPSFPPATLRLDGLERIYFNPLDTTDLRKLDPEIRNRMRSSPRQKIPPKPPQKFDDGDEDISFRDFSAQLPGHHLVIREIVQSSYSMKTRPIWWVFYDNDRRRSIWHYHAMDIKTKGLPNYSIREVAALPKLGLRLRLEGSMFRNGGAWTEKGIELVFQTQEQSLRLTSVQNSFSFLSGYNSSQLTAITEGLEADRFVKREVEFTPKPHHSPCGFTDPTTDETWRFDWNRLQAIADCLNRGRAKQTFRALNEPSFIENPAPAHEFPFGLQN